MIDFAESTTDGDIYLDDSQDFAMLQGADETAQAVVCQIETEQGEWPLDLEHGTNYKDKFFHKRSTRADAEMELRRTARVVPEVRNIYKMRVTEDDQPHSARAVGEIDTIYGRSAAFEVSKNSV